MIQIISLYYEQANKNIVSMIRNNFMKIKPTDQRYGVEEEGAGNQFCWRNKVIFR